MKITYIVLIIIFCNSFAKSQNSEYWNLFPHINSYREEVRVKLEDNHIDEIDIKRFFDLKTNDTAYLGIDEEEMLLLITGQYNVLLHDILERKTQFHKGIEARGIDKHDYHARHVYRFLQVYDFSLTESIKEYLQENESDIKNIILESNLTEEQIDFLILFCDYYLAINDYCNIKQEQKMIKESKEFLRNYPDSKYYSFVEQFINVEYKQGNWGIGMYYNMGSIFYSGSINKHLSNPLLIYVSWDLNYWKFDLNFGMGGSIYSKIKSEFNYETLWQENHQYTFSPIIGATLGYHFYESNNLNISPFVGARYLGLSAKSKEDSSYYENIGIDSENPWTFGLTIDYKFAHGTCKSNFLNKRGGYNERIFGDVRLKVAYQNPNLDDYTKDLAGGVWLVSLGIGFNYYPSKRKKNN